MSAIAFIVWRVPGSTELRASTKFAANYIYMYISVGFNTLPHELTHWPLKKVANLTLLETTVKTLLSGYYCFNRTPFLVPALQLAYQPI